MKQCKAGPTMVVMPDKTRYTRIHPETVSAILEEHFPSEPQPQASEDDSALKVEFAIASSKAPRHFS